MPIRSYKLCTVCGRGEKRKKKEKEKYIHHQSKRSISQLYASEVELKYYIKLL